MNLIRRPAKPETPRPEVPEADAPLSQCSPGQSGTVRRLLGGREFMGRVAALGFTPGAPVTVVRNDGHGPLIVAIRGAHLALGRGEARQIQVDLRD